MKYVNQAILVLLDGNKDFNNGWAAAKLGMKNLAGTLDIVSIDARVIKQYHGNVRAEGLAELFARMDPNSRLYIVAEGDENAVAGLDPTELAEFLRGNLLVRVRRISIVSCKAGRFRPDIQASWAGLFHDSLASKGIYTQVAARPNEVAVTEEGQKVTRDDAQQIRPNIQDRRWFPIRSFEGPDSGAHRAAIEAGISMPGSLNRRKDRGRQRPLR